jgi:N-ethylmaleimide reductase
MGCTPGKVENVNERNGPSLASRAPMFREVVVGGRVLLNRFAVAATTRFRSNPNGVPSDLMVEHYAARASAGMIITESTSVCYEGNPNP